MKVQQMSNEQRSSAVAVMVGGALQLAALRQWPMPRYNDGWRHLITL